MTLSDFLHLLNEDLRREYQHMLFYMHSANMLLGIERLYLAPKLKEHAASEMQHVFQFADKIRANGKELICTGLAAPDFPVGLTKAKEVLEYAVKIEEDVVANYHVRHKQAGEMYEQTGKNYDFIIFLEEQIEHSQQDIDELKLILAGL